MKLRIYLTEWTKRFGFTCNLKKLIGAAKANDAISCLCHLSVLYGTSWQYKRLHHAHHDVAFCLLSVAIKLLFLLLFLLQQSSLSLQP